MVTAVPLGPEPLEVPVLPPPLTVELPPAPVAPPLPLLVVLALEVPPLPLLLLLLLPPFALEDPPTDGDPPATLPPDEVLEPPFGLLMFEPPLPLLPLLPPDPGKVPPEGWQLGPAKAANAMRAAPLREGANPRNGVFMGNLVVSYRQWSSRRGNGVHASQIVGEIPVPICSRGRRDLVERAQPRIIRVSLSRHSPRDSP